MSIFYDGKKKIIATAGSTVKAAIDQLGVKLSPGDVVEPGLDTPINQSLFNINIYRAFPAVVIDEGKIYHVVTGYRSPRQIVTAAGLTVYPEDGLTLTKVDNFVADGGVGQKVVVTRAKPVQVIIGKQVYNFRTLKHTAGELLREKGLEFNPQDVSNTKLDSPIEKGQRIIITKIQQTIVPMIEPIPARVQIIYDPNQPINYSAVQTPGKDGQKRVNYLIDYQNGAEKNRRVLDSVILVDAADTVIVKGSQPLGVSDDVWSRLRLCEAGGDYSRNSGNGFYGAYQFDLGTWWGNGGKGLPSQASSAEQDAVAKRIQASRGWRPWPECSRRLGL